MMLDAFCEEEDDEDFDEDDEDMLLGSCLDNDMPELHEEKKAPKL